MPRFSEPERVPMDSLKGEPATAPKTDETLIQLIREAVEGTVQVCMAMVPLTGCVPSDLDCSPEVRPAIAALTKARASQLAGKPPSTLVCPPCQSVAVPDDCPTLFASTRRGRGCVAAVVLGEPEGEGGDIVRGPLSSEEGKAVIFEAPPPGQSQTCRDSVTPAHIV